MREKKQNYDKKLELDFMKNAEKSKNIILVKETKAQKIRKQTELANNIKNSPLKNSSLKNSPDISPKKTERNTLPHLRIIHPRNKLDSILEIITPRKIYNKHAKINSFNGTVSKFTPKPLQKFTITPRSKMTFRSAVSKANFKMNDKLYSTFNSNKETRTLHSIKENEKKSLYNSRIKTPGVSIDLDFIRLRYQTILVQQHQQINLIEDPVKFNFMDHFAKIVMNNINHDKMSIEDIDKEFEWMLKEINIISNEFGHVAKFIDMLKFLNDKNTGMLEKIKKDVSYLHQRQRIIEPRTIKELPINKVINKNGPYILC